MDTAAFRADLDLIPESLGRLADALDAGLAGLDRLALLGASRVLVVGMGSSRYAADVV
ncbi:iron dicitrate transport regulator FecR, partial [Agromyces binzhouensis]